ncbi:MAG TPA: hypothetical protein VF203_13775 [Burkholderiales bacterium]
MKTRIALLSATGAAALALAPPDAAHAGNLHVDIHLGFPVVVHRPAVPAPLVIHYPHVVYVHHPLHLRRHAHPLGHAHRHWRHRHPHAAPGRR